MNMISGLKRKENLLDVILNTVSDGITLIDKDLKIQYQNKIILQKFGSGIGEYCFETYRGRNIMINGNNDESLINIFVGLLKVVLDDFRKTS